MEEDSLMVVLKTSELFTKQMATPLSSQSAIPSTLSPLAPSTRPLSLFWRRYKPYALTLACTTLLVCTTSISALKAQASLKQARSADYFVNSIGTCLHLPHVNSVYFTHYNSIIKPRLLELGIRHVRDGVDNENRIYHDRINELGQAGIKFNFVVKPSFNLRELPTFASKVRGGLESFEGPNEWDLVGGTTWVKTLQAYQQSLYKTVKSNEALAKFPVLAPSIARSKHHNRLGNISTFLDYGNMHDYPGGWNPGTSSYKGINDHRKDAEKNSSSKTIIVTETGYHNALKWTQGHPPTPKAVVGKYMPRTFLEHFNRGIRRTYSYELIDQGTSQSDRDSNFGLLHHDGSPKPAFIALKNLISLLEDRGPRFSPGALDYTLSGNTSNIHKTLLQKRNRKFYLILWVEKPSYSPETKRLIAVPSQQVTLKLNTPISKAVTYLPNKSTNGTPRKINHSQLGLKVPDHPLVVELTPGR